MKAITLLPADSYRVVNKTIISEYDKKVIVDLYQPIRNEMLKKYK